MEWASFVVGLLIGVAIGNLARISIVSDEWKKWLKDSCNRLSKDEMIQLTVSVSKFDCSDNDDGGEDTKPVPDGYEAWRNN